MEELLIASVDKPLLQESKLGVEVNKVRKKLAPEDTLFTLTTQILTKWKGVLLQETPSTDSKAEEETIKDENGDEIPVLKRKSPAPEKSEPEPNRESSAQCFTFPVVSSKRASGDISEKSDEKRPKSASSVSVDQQEFMKPYLTGNETRDKCFTMLLTAIRVDDEDQSKDPDELTMSICRGIEECLFNEFKQSVDQPYRAKFRSRFLNLKDKKNNHLRSALLSGMITPDRFCSMSAAEMASEERRRQDLLLMEQNLKDSRAAQDNEAETDQFKCGRCHQRRTKYYQLQTRSADEPMTTFVTCINCGNRWKFC